VIKHKAFVVIDIPEPQKTAVQLVRDQLKTVTAKLPVEITLAGSSGLGPVPEGTDVGLVCDEVDRVASSMVAFKMEFGRISHFPDTGVFFIAPKDRRPFDSLHGLFASSRIPFAASPFPYHPHCTLRVGPKVDHSTAERIYSVTVPIGEMLLDSISVFTVDAGTQTVSLVHRTNLRE
jgi:2'-5' RNA ligase